MPTLENQQPSKRPRTGTPVPEDQDLTQGPLTQEEEAPPTQHPAAPTIRPEEPTDTSPSAIARDIVSDSIESLPDSIKSFILASYAKHHKLRSKITSQVSTKARLAEEDFTPRSARINFKLTGSDSAMETESFRALQTSVEEKVKAFQKDLTTAMLSTIQIEIDLNQAKMREEFLLFINNTVSVLFMMYYPKTKREIIPAHKLARFILSKQTEALYKFLPLNATNAQARYTDFAQDDVEYNNEAPPPNFVAVFNAIARDMTPILQSIYVESNEALLVEQERRNRHAAIDQQIRHLTVGQATEEAAEVIVTQPTADPKLIKELIAATVQKETKKLRELLNKKNQKARRTPSTPPKRNQKNSQRGARRQSNNNSTPATSNDNRNPSQTRRSSLKSRREPAAESANVTFDDSKRKKNNRNSKKSKKQSNAGKQQSRR